MHILRNNDLPNMCIIICKINFYTLRLLHSMDHSKHCSTRREKVSGRKIRKTVLSKNIRKYNHLNNKNKRIDLEEIPFTTMRVTVHALRWIFLLIFIYITVSIVLLLIQGGNDSITNIVVYSVTGFFTFFMGYFGWMFARNVVEMIGGKELKKEDF